MGLRACPSWKFSSSNRKSPPTSFVPGPPYNHWFDLCIRLSHNRFHPSPALHTLYWMPGCIIIKQVLLLLVSLELINACGEGERELSSHWSISGNSYTLGNQTLVQTLLPSLCKVQSIPQSFIQKLGTQRRTHSKFTDDQQTTHSVTGTGQVIPCIEYVFSPFAPIPNWMFVASAGLEGVQQ